MKPEQEIEELKARIAELESRLNAPDYSRFVPEKGEEYWLANGYGVVKIENENDHNDRWFIATGNCYRTEEQAETVYKIIHRIRELQDGFEVDWKSERQEVWTISWDREDQIFVTALIDYYLYKAPPFPTPTAAQTLIDEFGEDLKLLYGRL